MDDDVISVFFRQKGYFVIKIEIPLLGAAAPAGSGVPYTDSVEFKSVNSIEILQSVSGESAGGFFVEQEFFSVFPGHCQSVLKKLLSGCNLRILAAKASDFVGIV
jgi:hypothetical protein